MAWTNFAKHGDPTPPGSCLPTWTPQTQDSAEQVYWNIKDSKPQMTFEGNLYNIKERMAFWDEIFKSDRRLTNKTFYILFISLFLSKYHLFV